jgi:hypothetical protein
MIEEYVIRNIKIRFRGTRYEGGLDSQCSGYDRIPGVCGHSNKPWISGRGMFLPDDHDICKDVTLPYLTDIILLLLDGLRT